MPPVTATPAVGFLVGPGVLAHVDGVRALAERLGVAAVNTWGAKGVFRWDSPFHGGTAGLQARDFELAGLGEIDLLVTSGLDPADVSGAIVLCLRVTGIPRVLHGSGVAAAG